MAKDENKESEIRGDEQEIVDQRLPVWRPQDADREYYRYETKKRIQHYTVPPQTIFRPAKPTPTIRDAEHEFCELQRRANIMNGRTHSNVVSMTLNDYRVAPGVMFMTRSDPQLTFSQRSMKLNAVCWEKLGQQKYVEFLYHPVLEVIAVRSCNATNPNAVLWDETKKSGLQLCTSAFSNAVYDKLDWMRKYKFRFRGVTRVRGGEKIIFFFLDEPQILVGKDKKHLDAMDTSDSTVKYIPYKESECGEAAGLTAGIAYPENWQEQVGVSYEIKQQRGRVLDAVSSADIRNHGTKVVNPFIGVIPTHGELEDELEQIYEAM